MYKTILLSFFVSLLVVSCKTYTISKESLKKQLEETVGQKEMEINNPLYFGNLTYQANNLEVIEVMDKKGAIHHLTNKPSLEIRITTHEKKKYTMYLDTLIFEKDTIKGSRSRFSPNVSYAIPYESIQNILIQDGGKKFAYTNK